MRPKSPFLQNLRKKTPPPRMSKKKSESKAGGFGATSDKPRPFQAFQLVGQQENKSFMPWSVEAPRPEPEEEEAKEPPIDLAKEKRIAHDIGYQKAKAEYEQYKVEAEKLERAFQEIANSMEEARHAWVREVREEIAESIHVALHHIIKNETCNPQIYPKLKRDSRNYMGDPSEFQSKIG